MTVHNPTAQHIVLDLETLSTKPNAVVISIGAVALDGQGNFLSVFHQAINPNQPGRDIDQATVQWWESQSAEAQEASYKAKDTVTPTVAMYMFSAWICCVGSPEEVKMWGNGSSFDCTILSSLYDQCHELRHPKPWAWWHDRDMRTLLDTFPEARDVGEFVGVKHHALHDAQHEAKQLAKALRLMAAAKGARTGPVQMPAVPTAQMLMALMSPGEQEVMDAIEDETFALLLLDRSGVRERYDAMLAAAPQAPPAASEAASTTTATPPPSDTLWRLLTGGYDLEYVNKLDNADREKSTLIERAAINWRQICREIGAEAAPQAAPAQEPGGYDTMQLYKDLQDLWSEASAVDTIIGRQDVLLRKITKMRDAVGKTVATYLPIGPAPQAAPAEQEGV
jgi:exodeoxyribonuclease VIII